MTPVVLFDLDNTLIDRDGAFRHWAGGFLADRDLDPTELEWVRREDDDGKASRHVFFAALRARFGLSESVEDLVGAYQEAIPTLHHPEPHVLAGLRALRAAGWKTAVVTNGPATQESKIRSAGLDTVLDAWCISGLVGVAKPERAIFEEAARRAGATLQGWMVGDTAEIDILGGIGAGLRTIWMARDRPWTAREYEPELMAGDVAEAARLILESDSA
jgi:FMN phosphatase YigB (HAD superfamily)